MSIIVAGGGMVGAGVKVGMNVGTTGMEVGIGKEPGVGVIPRVGIGVGGRVGMAVGPPVGVGNGTDVEDEPGVFVGARVETGILVGAGCWQATASAVITIRQDRRAPDSRNLTLTATSPQRSGPNY